MFSVWITSRKHLLFKVCVCAQWSWTDFPLSKADSGCWLAPKRTSGVFKLVDVTCLFSLHTLPPPPPCPPSLLLCRMILINNTVKRLIGLFHSGNNEELGWHWKVFKMAVHAPSQHKNTDAFYLGQKVFKVALGLVLILSCSACCIYPDRSMRHTKQTLDFITADHFSFIFSRLNTSSQNDLRCQGFLFEFQSTPISWHVVGTDYMMHSLIFLFLAYLIEKSGYSRVL